MRATIAYTFLRSDRILGKIPQKNNRKHAKYWFWKKIGVYGSCIYTDKQEEDLGIK